MSTVRCFLKGTKEEKEEYEEYEEYEELFDKANYESCKL